MKRFLLFFVESYYPRGGWDDFKKDYDTLEEAHAAGKAYVDSDTYCGRDTYHIVDTNNLQFSGKSEWVKIDPEED